MTPPSSSRTAADDDTGTGPDDGATTSEAADATGSPASDPGFFAWLRTLGIERRTGWLGGVCAGLAHRTGVDVVLVRGIVVVLACIGAPVVLLYAIAWALLPDEQGGIHVQELIRGRVTRALPGILAMFLVSFLPVAQGVWSAGALYWGDVGWDGAVARAAVTGIVLIGAAVLVVWLARRTTGAPVAATAPEGSRAESAAAPVVAAAAAPAAARPVAPEPGEEPQRPVDASDEELAEWRRQQEEWKRQRADWAAEQRRTQREQRQAEAHARALEAAHAAQERARIRRLAHPRAGAGAVFLVLGLGVVAAAVATLLASQARGMAGIAGAAWIIGAATLVLVLGLGTVVVALCRRRSGALAFLSMIAVLLLAVSLVVPSDRRLLFPGGSDIREPGRYAQVAGSVFINVEHTVGSPRVIDLWHWDGSLDVYLQEGATVRIDAASDQYLSLSLSENLEDGSHQQSSFDSPEGRTSVTFGAGAADVILKVWTHRSQISVATWGDEAIAVSREPEHRDRISAEGEQLEPLRAGESVSRAAEGSETGPQPEIGSEPESESATTEGVAP